MSDRAKSMSNEELEACRIVLYFIYDAKRRSPNYPNRLVSLLMIKVLADIEKSDLPDLSKISDEQIDKSIDMFQVKYNQIINKSKEYEKFKEIDDEIKRM